MKQFLFLALLLFIIFGSPTSLANHTCPRPGGGTEPGEHYSSTDTNNPPRYSKGDPMPCTFIGKIAKDAGFDISNIFGWAIGIGSIVALGVITYGGTRYAASGLFGEHASETQIHEAKAWVFAGLQGLAVLILSYVIINTINPSILLF